MLEATLGIEEQQSFVKEWPLERLENLTLQEYTNLDKESSLVYWLECKTNNTGGIAGGSAYKFGIFKQKNEVNEHTDKRHSTDGIYSWYSKYGSTKEQAFQAVKGIILKAVKASKSNDWQTIDELDIGDVLKWKLAYLFSPDYILPIYKSDILERAAQYKGLSSFENKTMSALYKFLINKKPGSISTLEYAVSLWTAFGTDSFYFVIQKFLEQAETDSMKKVGYPRKYKDLKVEVSFGVGNQARIPWIGLLNANNKISHGIYPVYLYFKEVNHLILAYGISETNPPDISWTNQADLPLIKDWYINKFGSKPARYGGSFIMATYDLNDDLSINKIENDLGKIISDYQISSPEVLQEPNDTEYSTNGPRYWLVSPGQAANMWEDFYDKGYVGLDWSKISDLQNFSSKEEIRQKLILLYPEEETSQKNGALALWEFANQVKRGDIIIPKKGHKKYLGYGIVQSDYSYENENDGFIHRRKVKWIKKGVWPEEVGQIVTKTFTDISKYPEYVDRLKRLIGIGQNAQIPAKVNHWWLNANPKFWRITDFEIGEEQSYTTHNENGNKRSKFEHFKSAKSGDLMIGYESSPIKKAVAILEVTKGIFIDEDDGEEKISFVIQKFLPRQFTWSELKELTSLEEAEPLKNNQGSLFKLSSAEFKAIVEANLIKKNELYTKENALSEIFINEYQLDNISNNLQYKNNIILQGPPGTGKTFLAKRLAYLMMEQKDETRTEIVQFHQSYSYEDFIQGFRPQEDGTFKLENGVFYRFCKKAANDPNNDYFFIIDEINRGNLSKVFGELMLLIEKDKREPTYAVSLTYSQASDTKFYIPKNLYIIGTMNTADRSLALVDYALRRRFSFIELLPSIGDELSNHLIDAGVDEVIVNKIISRIPRLNKNISDDRNLGPGFQIGHSYFCPSDLEEERDYSAWYESVVKYEIVPLLQEYWFDNLDEVKRWEELLLE